MTDLLPPTAPDATIVECAVQERQVILTQDLDFTSVIALSGHAMPSLIPLRLESSTIESVNAALPRALPALEQELALGALVP